MKFRNLCSIETRRGAGRLLDDTFRIVKSETSLFFLSRSGSRLLFPRNSVTVGGPLSSTFFPESLPIFPQRSPNKQATFGLVALSVTFDTQQQPPSLFVWLDISCVAGGPADQTGKTPSCSRPWLPSIIIYSTTRRPSCTRTHMCRCV